MPFTLSTRPNMVPILLRSRSRCVGLHKLPLEKGGIWNKKTLSFKTFQPSLLNLIARTVLRNEVKMSSSQLWLRFQQSQIKPENIFGASTEFEPVASALTLLCSTNWPIYWVHRTRERNETYHIAEIAITTAMITSSLHLYVRSSHNIEMITSLSFTKPSFLILCLFIEYWRFADQGASCYKFSHFRRHTL